MAAWTLPTMILPSSEFVTTALDRRSRKHFFNIIPGMILSGGRWTVSSWFRAGNARKDRQDHCHFLQLLGRCSKGVATQLLHLAVRHISVSHVGEFVTFAIDDLPTKRSGKTPELAGRHHKPTPGSSGTEFPLGNRTFRCWNTSVKRNGGDVFLNSSSRVRHQDRRQAETHVQLDASTGRRQPQRRRG